MSISTEQIKELRDITSAGIMDCRNALIKADGDMEKAAELLKEQSLVRIEKKSQRQTSQGLVESYVHTGGRIGAMVEVNCETDFVARTPEFQELVHNIAMQVAAQEPQCITREQLAEDADVEPEIACLMLQPFIRDPDLTIQDLINEVAAKVGENVKVSRFARFELGRDECQVCEIKIDVATGTDA